MKVNLIKDDKKLTIMLEGCLDSFTAPEVEEIIDENLNGIDELVMDLEKLEYISSAGLRVVLRVQKMMGPGKMTVIHVNESVMEVFEMTGFDEILKIS